MKRERDRGEVQGLVWYWEEEGAVVGAAVTSATERSGRRHEEKGRRPYRFEARQVLEMDLNGVQFFPNLRGVICGINCEFAWGRGRVE